MAPDAAALARAAAGDARAFDLVVRTHEARVRSFLAGVAGANADDLAQLAFLAAWRRAGSFRGESGVAAWLLGLAWGVFLTDARTRRRAAARDTAWHALSETTAPPPQDAQVDHDRVLAALDARERAALVLTLGHGYSQAETAAIMGEPLGTLKSLQARARAKAAAMLTEVTA